MKIALKMTGCKNNRYELEQVLRWAIKNKVPVVKEEEADYCIINTCTVTHVADKKSRQMIRRTKNVNPDLKTVVFGCGARMQKEAFDEIEEVDILLNDLDSVIQFLEVQMRAACRPKRRAVKSDFASHARSRAMVQIQDGCDNYCAYCIIAAARGKSRSHPIDSIIREIRDYREEGYNEVILTGINIGAYGAINTTRPEQSHLADLLEEILDKTDIPRIRLSSLGPEYFNERLFNALKHPRICRHIHLAIQSASDSVLQRMLRQYDVKRVEMVMQRLKTDIPGIAITSDFIVGFPEETDEEFQETTDFINNNPLAKAHVFPYSIRQNTLAAEMRQVDEDTKKARAKFLQNIADKQREGFIGGQMGKEHDVLWETSTSDSQIMTGLTDNYIRVCKKGDYPVKSISREKLTDDIVIWE